MDNFYLYYVPGIGWVNSNGNVDFRDQFLNHLIQNGHTSFNAWAGRLHESFVYHFISFNSFERVECVASENTFSGTMYCLIGAKQRLIQ